MVSLQPNAPYRIGRWIASPPALTTGWRAESPRSISDRLHSRTKHPATCEPALALDGGGARAAYQVGVLSALSRRFPEMRFPILTGVSAGAINTAILANHPGTFGEGVDDLARLWARLEVSNVFWSSGMSLLKWVLQTGAHLLRGASPGQRVIKGMVDTGAMREFLRAAMRTGDGSLPGIATNLRAGRIDAVALTATRYATGEAVTFCAGRETASWDRPHLRAVATDIRIDHVMASSALPLIYPAVAVDGAWYGDGEISLRTPLAPALHLGADRILVISTRAERRGGDEPVMAPSVTHPAPGDVMSVLYDALFTDRLGRDAQQLNRVNALIRRLAPGERRGLRDVKLLVIRPSRDLGAVAFESGIEVPEPLRFLARRLDLRRESARNFLSVIMLQPSFMERLLEIGERDGERRADEVAAFLAA